MTTRATLTTPPTAPAAVPARPSGPSASDTSIDRGEDQAGPRRFRPVLRPFRTPVRGHAFAAAPAGGSEPEAGIRARLSREPVNPADPLAVAVWVETDDERPWRIGYLDRGVAARVAPRLDAGLHLDARVDGWVTEPEGRWHRPLVLLVPDAASASDPGDAPGVDSAEPLWGRPPGVSRRVVRQR